MNMGCDFSTTRKEKEFDIIANNTESKSCLNTFVFLSFSLSFVSIKKTTLDEAIYPMKLYVCMGSGKTILQNNLMLK
jgi:hypothetical protein